MNLERTPKILEAPWVYILAIVSWLTFVNTAAYLELGIILGDHEVPWYLRIVPSIVGLTFGVFTAVIIRGQRRVQKNMREIEDREAKIVDLNAKLAAAMTRTEKALHESEYRLVQSQKMEQLGRLTGGVVHDYNNILTGIIGGVGILAETITTPDELETLELVQDACDRATMLNRRLLSFSRQRPESMECLDVNQRVEQLLPMLSWFKPRNIVLETALGDGRAPVWFGEGVLEQVVLNLVINAVDAFGGEPGVVRLETETNDGQVRLSVIDTGPGMDEATRTRVFEAFFTTKGENGTGLGLSIVKTAVERYGVDITLVTQVGDGARFDLYFEEAPESDLGLESSSDPELVNVNGERVLLVDGDSAILTVSRVVLERSGYRVDVCETCEAAVDLATNPTSPFDVVVTNIALADGDGMRLLENVRARCPSSNFVLMSSFEEAESTAEKSDVAFLSKPFTPSQLRKVVRDSAQPR